jgi:hypothetical protein
MRPKTPRLESATGVAVEIVEERQVDTKSAATRHRSRSLHMPAHSCRVLGVMRYQGHELAAQISGLEPA